MVLRIAACCADADAQKLQQGFRQYSENHGIQVHGVCHPDHRSFLDALEHSSLWDFLIVAIPGARGMETVVSTRELAPETPLLWCSDDTEFAIASYRLRCDLFLQMPLSSDQVETAIRRCLTA